MPLDVSTITGEIDAHRDFADVNAKEVWNLITKADALARAGYWGTQPAGLNPPTKPTLDKIPTLPTMAVPPAIRNPADPAKPTLQTITFDAPAGPADFTEVLASTPLPTAPTAVANFSKSAPTLTAPSLPAEVQQFSGQAPTLTQVSIPNAPTVALPQFSGAVGTAPSIDAMAIVAKFDDALKSAADQTEADLNTVVTGIRESLIPGYDSKVALLQNKLEELVQGRGIYDTTVEDGIYERSRSKENAETARVQQDALLAAARRGFTLPTGALMSAVQQARQAGANNNAATSREIAVKQMELQFESMKFAVTQLAAYDKMMVDASLGYLQSYIAMRGHGVELAKAAASAMQAANQQLVELYSMNIKVYEAEANVYEAKIRGSLASVEVFKAQIEAEKAKVDVDIALVNAFETQVKAHSAQVDAYGKRVQAVVSLAELEKIKIDAFTAEVSAYNAQVNAKAAEWQGYSAAMQGQRALADAYSARAQAYAAKVDSYKARVQGEAERVRALGITNESELKAYEAALRANAADLDAQKAISTATLEQNKNLIAGYEAASKAVIATAELELQVFKTEADQKLEMYKTGVERYLREAKISSDANLSGANLNMEGAKAYATMIGGAMSGINGVLSATAS